MKSSSSLLYFSLVVITEFVSVTYSTRKFIQISDLHLDVDYIAGGDVQLMCHGPNTTANSNVTTSGSLLTETEGGASKYGDFRCDSPKKLVLSALRYLKQIEPNPDFILWTGDSSPHWKDDQNHSWDEVYANLKMITKKLHQTFPDTLIIPALGNHDSHPADFFSDPSQDASGSKKIYSGYIEEGSFGDLLRNYKEAISKFKECGFYSIRQKSYTKENITQTFIVLNTNLYYNNKAATNVTDPCGQFKWLEDELRATKDNERVFIVAHVPPGFFELNPKSPFFNNDNHTIAFQKIVSDKRYAQKIVAHFYGHLHTDALRLFVSNDDDVFGVAFAAPSVTPLMFEGGVNPSVRVYDYDPESRTILNYVTHYLDLDKLIVHNDDEVDVDVDDVHEGEAKSRRKFLARESRQTSQENTTASTTTSKPTTSSEEFESLATGVPTTNKAEEEETTTAMMRSDNDVVAVTTVPSTNVNNSTSSDPDIDFLVGRWTFGYDKRVDLNVADLSPKSVFKAHLQMKKDRTGFKNYYRQTWVLHDPHDRMECNETCYHTFMCAMVHFTREDFFDCLGERGVSVITPPSVTILSDVTGQSTITTTTTPTTTTKSWPSFVKPFVTTSSSTDSEETIFDSQQNLDSVAIEPTEKEDGQSGVVRGVAIGFAGIALIAIAGFSFALYRRTRMHRYRSQEFLLTDSVFRYDGYAQVEQP